MVINVKTIIFFPIWDHKKEEQLFNIKVHLQLFIMWVHKGPLFHFVYEIFTINLIFVNHTANYMRSIAIIVFSMITKIVPSKSDFDPSERFDRNHTDEEDEEWDEYYGDS